MAEVDGFEATATAPAAVEDVAVEIDVASQEQYWFWAYGVEVTATGMQPGEKVTISVVLSSGVEKKWSASVADSDGNLTRRVAYINVDPDNTHPDAGLAQIRVTTASGAVGSAVLDITPNEGETLEVSTDPETISQDAFLDEPVLITVTGFEPWDKVYFNLGLPDTTMGVMGETEGLHADANGVFTYELQAATANSQLGEWLLSFQSDDDLQGSGTFEVTAGAPRQADKTISLADESITQEGFNASPGLQIELSGFLAFDTYELIVTTPRGGEFSLGLARTNGEGYATNGVIGPSSAPLGTYSLLARSTTTGSYAEAEFDVEGDGGPREPQVSLQPSTLTGEVLQDPAQGTVLVGTDLVPSTRLRISLRDSSWDRLALTVGADAYVTVGGDGTFRVALSTLETPPAGQYTVWATSGSGTLAYNLKLLLTVTTGSTAEPDTTVAPSSDEPSTTPEDTPDSSVPSSPSPSPVDVIPAEDEPVTPSEQDGFELPSPALPTQ